MRRAARYHRQGIATLGVATAGRQQASIPSACHGQVAASHTAISATHAMSTLRIAHRPCICGASLHSSFSLVALQLASETRYCFQAHQPSTVTSGEAASWPGPVARFPDCLAPTAYSLRALFSARLTTLVSCHWPMLLFALAGSDSCSDRCISYKRRNMQPWLFILLSVYPSSTPFLRNPTFCLQMTVFVMSLVFHPLWSNFTTPLSDYFVAETRC